MQTNCLVFFLLAFIVCFNPMISAASQTKEPYEIERVSPEQTREKVQRGEALLVCSYEDRKCQSILLEGGLLRSEFESKLNSLEKDQEIIFYCG